MNDAGTHAGAGALRPLHDNILMRLVMAEDRTPGGVIVPDTARVRLDWGDVVAVGPGRRTATDAVIPPAVAAGDRVVVMPHSARDVTIGGERLAIVSERDVLGVIRSPSRETQRAASPGLAGEVRVERFFAEPALAGREESLESDVAPDLLEDAEPTAEDLH